MYEKEREIKARPDNITVNFNEAKSITVLENDLLYKSISRFTQGKLGKVTSDYNSDEFFEYNKFRLLYTPNKNVYGKDTFEYTISNGKGKSSTTVTVNINPPRAIEINDDNGSCVEDESLKIDFILNNDKTEVIGPLEIVDFTDLENGIVEKINDNYFFVPDQDFNGDGGFRYTVKDALNRIATGSVSIEVTPVPDSPQAFDDKIQAFNDETKEIDVVKNDIDVDGDNIHVVKVFDYYSNGRKHLGTMKIKANKLYYTPYKGESGIDKFKYTIKDEGELEATGIVTVAVVSRGKTINKTIYIDEDNYTFLTIAGHGVDINDYPQSADIELGRNRVGYIPHDNFNGEDFFTFYYKNNNNGTDYMKVKAIVNPVNDTPDAIADEFLVEVNSIDNIFNVLSNDIDVDGDNLTIKSIGLAKNGTAAIKDNKIVYNPAKDFKGQDTITYTISDGTGETSIAIVNIIVSPVNNEPIAMDDEFTIQEDTEESIFDVLKNDTDIDGDNIIIEKINTVKYGSVSIKDNKVVYYSAKDFYGEDIIIYTISDGRGGKSIATVKVVVNNVIDDIIPVDDKFTVEEDSIDNVFDVLINDINVDNNNLKIKLVGSNDKISKGGDFRINGNKVIYNPAKDFNGVEKGVYLVCGDSLLGFFGWFTITVNPVNDAPTAVDDIFVVDVDSIDNVFDVLINDTDVDGDNIEIESITTSEHSIVRIQNNELIYSPVNNFNGQDTITYTISDGNGGTSTATITVTVNPPNNNPKDRNKVPRATDDSFEVVANSENNEFDALSNDSDVDGDTLTIASVGTPQHGAATIESNKIKYTPNAEYSGEDTVTYTISDGKGGIATGTIAIIVKVVPVNNNPIATNDSFEVDVNSENNEIDVLSNDSDTDGDTLTISSVGTSQHGASTIESNKIKYTPNAEYSGEDTITYTISDGKGGTATATITINVKVAPVNNNPVATDDSFEVDVNSENNEFDVLNNDSDADGDTLAIASVGTPQHGVATIESNKIKYTPNTEYSGEDTITYTISDGNGGIATGTITINVKVIPVNNNPIATDDSFEVEANSENNELDVLNNDRDADGDTLTIASVRTPQHGTATIDSNKIKYTPNAEYSGEDTITYTISDGNGGTATGQVTVTVNPANNPPVAVDDTMNLTNPPEEVGFVLVNDYDDENDPFSITSFTQGQFGTVRREGNRFIYEPVDNFSGHDTFTYTITDAQGRTSIATVTIMED